MGWTGLVMETAEERAGKQRGGEAFRVGVAQRVRPRRAPNGK